jgi:hypothetical protein
MMRERAAVVNRPFVWKLCPTTAVVVIRYLLTGENARDGGFR